VPGIVAGAPHSTGDTSYIPAMPTTSARLVGRWLALWCAMLVALVVIGGVTRLTESGLSITEWKPVSGVIPPLTRQAWEAEFSRYQQIPEYQLRGAAMTLGDFQRIYFWEYLHRLWARLLGAAFALPLAWFVIRGHVRGALAKQLGALLILLGAQGALGWYMVRSGLVDRVDVSQYRLAAHLGLALLLYAWALWLASTLLTPPPLTGSPRARVWSAAFTGYVFVTVIAGAFVAGLDAGHAWNTFPLMGGSFLPGGYGQMSPAWVNAFENPAAVQFHHRWLGIGALLGAVGLWIALRREAEVSVRARTVAGMTAVVGVGQALLGISTLLLVVPIPLAAAHQFGAVMLITFAVLTLRALTPQG
jgi:cytochrome c oxidase assembly protein subunit 15